MTIAARRTGGSPAGVTCPQRLRCTWSRPVFEHLSLEDAKLDVLLTLVRNRCFRPEAKSALLDRLDGLALEDNRREILDAMSKR